MTARTLPRPLPWILYPGVLAAALLTSVVASRLGAPEGLAVTGSVLLWGGLVLVLERIFPLRPDWKVDGRTMGIDLMHTVLWHGVVPLALRASVLGAVVGFGAEAAAGYGLAVWPTELPVLLQAALALCLGEFTAYWIHRFGHESAIGWRIHAVHHSVDKMHGLAAGRNHPLNVLVSYLGQVTPLLLLGVPAEVLALHAVFTGVNGPLQHANLDMRTGPLSWFFATPDHHLWHHSTVVEHSNANYGSNVLVWDVLFGSRRIPHHRPLPEQVGLEHDFPTSFFAQVAWPFTREAGAVLKAQDEARAAEDQAPGHDPACVLQHPSLKGCASLQVNHGGALHLPVPDSGHPRGGGRVAPPPAGARAADAAF